MTEYRALVKDGHKVIRMLSKKADSVVLHMQDADDKDYVLRIYSQEKKVYRVLAQRAFKNMPDVRATYIKDGFFLVEEEYVDGVSMQEMVSGGARFEHDRAAQIATEVCRAAAFIHENGFIHRDIKPEHVLLTPEGRIVLIDLDSAMEIRPDKLNDTQLLGTAMYAAPEQFGLTRSDVRTDIYAIGIFLNEIVTGYHPAVKQYREGVLAEIITKCISMNPEDRYQSAEDLAAALSRPHAPKKTNGRLIAILGTAAAVILAAIIFIVPGGEIEDTVTPDDIKPPVTETTPDAKLNQQASVLTLPEGCLPLYKEIQRSPIYYNSRSGAQSAPLYTDDGVLIDQSYHVYADEAIGEIIGWNHEFGGYELYSRGCKTGATGYIHAEKDGKHYVMPVIIQGEIMSIYSGLPDYNDFAKSYLEPQPGKIPGELDHIIWEYEAGKETVLYIVINGGFDKLIPQCTNEHVTIEKYQGEANWPYPIFTLTFRNPEGGDVPFEIKSNYDRRVLRFIEK